MLVYSQKWPNMGGESCTVMRLQCVRGMLLLIQKISWHICALLVVHVRVALSCLSMSELHSFNCQCPSKTLPIVLAIIVLSQLSMSELNSPNYPCQSCTLKVVHVRVALSQCSCPCQSCTLPVVHVIVALSEFSTPLPRKLSTKSQSEQPQNTEGKILKVFM